MALANWPGHIKPGVVDGMMHIVDIYPTLATLANASLEKTQAARRQGCLDDHQRRPVAAYRTGLQRRALSRRHPRRRPEARLDVAPAAERRTFRHRQDPGEATNLAQAQPDAVAALQARASALAAEAKPASLHLGADQGSASVRSRTFPTLTSRA